MWEASIAPGKRLWRVGMTDDSAARESGPADRQIQAEDADTKAKEQEETSAAVREIEAFLESGLVESLEKALDRHLSGPVTEETFRVARDAGMLIVGEAGFGAVIWVVSKHEPAKALEALDMSTAAQKWFKEIIAVYGERLRQALHNSDVVASKKDDWEAFGWDLRINPRDGEYEITTEIQKYNGEKLVINAGLPSAVRLAERTLEPLAGVESLNAVSATDREALATTLDAVREKLAASGPPDSEGREE